MEWVMAATEALQRGNATEAERLFKRALEVAPNEPDILNNLGAAYASQGRYDEAEALLHKIYREHPDYFFGIVGMANLHTLQGDTEQAKALLQPLLSRKRLHFSEFATLCKAHIQLYLAEGRPESAQSWLDMWANIDPDNPDIRYWRRQIRQGDKAAKLGRKSGWREWASFWT
jgi:Flp pilus assembly protein TadD